MSALCDITRGSLSLSETADRLATTPKSQALLYPWDQVKPVCVFNILDTEFKEKKNYNSILLITHARKLE